MTDDNKPKGPGGRPSKYRPEMCDTVIELGKKGKAVASMAAACGVSKQTLYEWINPKGNYYIAEFSDAMQVALTYSEAWWSELGDKYAEEDVLGKKKLNTANYKWQTAVRFKWKETTVQEQHVTEHKPVETYLPDNGRGDRDHG